MEREDLQVVEGCEINLLEEEKIKERKNITVTFSISEVEEMDQALKNSAIPSRCELVRAAIRLYIEQTLDSDIFRLRTENIPKI